jgi:hypothetical protein
MKIFSSSPNPLERASRLTTPSIQGIFDQRRQGAPLFCRSFLGAAQEIIVYS